MLMAIYSIYGYPIRNIIIVQNSFGKLFFYGTNKDILGEDIDDNTIRYILPSEIKASDELGSYTSFYPN
ncbi:hypothetical protein LMZ02_03100 [Paenibacillus macerans]|uniref:hypothetical protein n=1 Tax=Paenibacillus macerans TaxID=44252 RepID=UPI000ED3AB49|nr:hypothetical protein [Paenibacillus macerans]UMV48406.1 hypothetical protein LMZ02_03100 [Paenibacillus macerans]GBK62507.1 hypothetical protein PbDSM24746_25110 [Paenibacillus macerans]GBK68819.1 hypothetical protein PbJCM17693_25270 [Paenibacillus macerans]